MHTDGEVRQGQGQEVKAAQGLAGGGSLQWGISGQREAVQPQACQRDPLDVKGKGCGRNGALPQGRPDMLLSSSDRKGQAQETGTAFLLVSCLLGPELTASWVPQDAEGTKILTSGSGSTMPPPAGPIASPQGSPSPRISSPPHLTGLERQAETLREADPRKPPWSLGPPAFQASPTAPGQQSNPFPDSRSDLEKKNLA